MPRFKITIEYDGTGLVGWQRQDNGPSVQAALEQAATAIIGNRYDVLIQGAGRTDAGVHALGQVAHFDLATDFDAYKMPLAFNAHLPDTIRVIDAEQVADDFHARFQATGRAYRYRLYTRRVASAIERGYVWHIAQPLDRAAMEEAASRLIGLHDFSTFRATHCQALSPVKTLDVLRFEEEPQGLTLIAEARSFLHHQIRNITGTLVQVGLGKWTADDVSTALAAKSRAAGGPTAPPDGLYLTSVSYDGTPLRPDA